MESTENITKTVEMNLLTHEYPFTWQPRDNLYILPDNLIAKISVFLEDTFLETEFPYAYLMLYVVQTYEYGYDGKVDEALKTLKSGEEKFVEWESKNCPNEESLRSIHSAFLNIIKATKAHLLLKRGDTSAAVQVMGEISAKNNTKDEKAGFLLLKAIFFGYFEFNGLQKAVFFSMKAEEENPGCEVLSLCLFFKSRFLAQLRHCGRLHFESMKNELSYFDEAVNLKDFNFYALHIAEFYRECAEQGADVTGKTRDELLKTSLELYKKNANFAESEKDPQNLFRCARGILLLPSEVCDSDYAKKLIDKGLEMAPDSIGGQNVMLYFNKKKMIENYLAASKLYSEKHENRAAKPLDSRVLFQPNHSELDVLLTKLRDLKHEFDDKTNTSARIGQDLLRFYLHDVEDIHAAFKCAKHLKFIQDKFPAMHCSSSDVESIIVLVDKIKTACLDPRCSEEDKTYYVELLNELSTGQHTICDDFVKSFYVGLLKELNLPTNALVKPPEKDLSSKCEKLAESLTKKLRMNAFHTSIAGAIASTDPLDEGYLDAYRMENYR